MWHNNKFKHSHVLIMIMMSFLLQCGVNSSSTFPTDFLGNVQLVAKADDKPIMCIDTERHALLDFKAGLQQQFPNLHPACISAWGTKKEDDCCNWSSVRCNNQTGHVTELYLSACDLEGKISPSLLNLTYLNYLDLSYNSFNGSIPEFIGSLTELTALFLFDNSFSGSVPKSIGSLTQLSYLDLSYNFFNGNILESVGSLTQLSYLDLSHNSFNGTILESVGSLTQLTHLDLSSNSFSGNIPESMGSLTELTHLGLSYNSFRGNIPPEFGNLVNLERLDLDDIGRCSVENISWLSRLSHLEELHMSGISLAKANHWVNAILSLQDLTKLHLEGCDLSQVMHPYSSSSSHVNYSSNIVELYLSDNSLNSSMYPWLYPLTRSNTLEHLSLSGNKLNEFPKYLGNLCNLRYLHFDNNSALVPFSNFLKTLSAGCTSATLELLFAPSSQFTGSISDDIQHFSSLTRLYLDHNQLKGTISEKIWELPMLEGLYISSNSLRDASFEKLGKSRIGIMYINLSSNNLSGKAPTFTGSCLGLDLSSNNFYGPIMNVPSAYLLNLSRNNFCGEISFLCQNEAGSLTYLDLSHNSFSGQIPDCLWNLKELQILNLAHNNLSGRLPASVGHLDQLEVLYLYNNKFSGELPLSLGNCSMLTFLDLGANRFSGSVPVWIGENLSGLYVLSLGSNNFFGPIPLQVCQLENLRILDFSVNNLNGTIPSCVKNLTSMVQQGFLSAHNLHQYVIETPDLNQNYDYIDNAIVQWQGIRREFTNNLRLLKIIDLSSNNLTGKIPNELSDLHGLLALNLSMNALFGEIPHKIGEVEELLTLDLSRNHFSGRIPPSISEMTSLNFLDLSYNNLSGRIPSSTQLQSFNASSYTGNARLCGLPLSKYCPGDEKLPVPSPVGEREGGGGGGESDKGELDRWFYIGGAIGFSVGFWIVCSTLLVNRRGRHTFFPLMDSLENWVYVKVVVFKAKFHREAHE